MFPWAALYVVQVAIGMAVWPWLYQETDWWMGVLVALPFAALAVLLWRAKTQFNGMVAENTDVG
jgi:hypothetical protein